MTTNDVSDTRISAERLQKMLNAEIPLGMSVEDARSLISEVISRRTDHDMMANFVRPLIPEGQNPEQAESVFAWIGMLDHYRKLASRHPQPVNEPAEPDQWRDLALQFDGHRIECLSMLRFAVRWIEEYATVRDILREPLASLKTFLAAPPLPGEAVLAARIEALRASSIPTPERSKEETVGVKAFADAILDLAKDGMTENDLSFNSGLCAALEAIRPLIDAALETPPLHKEGETRKTFVVPDGFEAVRDADGHATGEVRPIAAPVPVPVTITDAEKAKAEAIEMLLKAGDIWTDHGSGFRIHFSFPPNADDHVIERVFTARALSAKPTGEE